MPHKTHQYTLYAYCLLFLSLSVHAVSEYTLDNGLQILVKEDHRAPVVISQVWYKVGASYELNGRTGLSHMLEHMMFKGTDKHAPGTFSRLMAEQGARENAFTTPDYTVYFQKLASNRLAISFELEADRMRSLLLLDEEFQKEREVVIEERRSRTDDRPISLLYEIFRATAYQTNPYRNPTIGWPSDLKNLTLADLRDWYQQWYAPNNAILVVVGDVQPDAVYALAKQHFGSLPRSQITAQKPQPERPQWGIKRIVVKRPAQLPYLIMGYKTPVLNTLDEKQAWKAYALELLAYVLDGGDSARLSRELIRGSEIATSIGASYDLFGRLEDLFSFMGIPNQQYDVAALEQAVREQIKQVQTTLVSDAELNRIKTQLRASKVFAKDSISGQAIALGQFEAVGLSWQLADQYLDKISEITPEQIREVAIEYLQDEGLTVGVLEPQAIIPPSQTKEASHD
jgi:zinc protease